MARRLTFLMALLIWIAGPLAAQEKEKDKPKSIQQLAWLAGSWKGTHQGGVFEEHWTGIAGQKMIGMGRFVRGGKTGFSEFLRLEQRKQKIVMTVLAEAQGPVPFRLIKLTATEAVFENPKHDFPQRIIYRKLKQDGMLVRIEGLRGKRVVGVDFRLKRVKSITREVKKDD